MPAIVSRGIESPSTAGGGGGGSGPSGVVIPFLVYDSDGELANVADFSSWTLMISVGGADFAAAVGDAPVNIGGGPDGSHYYVLDEAELPSPGSFVIFSAEETGYKDVREVRWFWATATDVETSTTTTAANISNAISAIEGAISAAITAINANTDTDFDAVPTVGEIDTQLTASHGSGAWSGAVLADIIAGIYDENFDTDRSFRGFLQRADAVLCNKATGMNGPTARFYMADGTTAAVVIAVDPDAGTRGLPDISETEPE